MRRAWIVVGLILTTIVVGVTVRVLGSACPLGWKPDVSLRSANNEAADIGAASIRLHVDVSRDFSLRGEPPPFGSPHPLVVGVTLTAPRTADLQAVDVACVRLTDGGNVWTRRPSTSEIRTSPASPSAGAWRLAVAEEGPEWPVGDSVAIVIWIVATGRSYTIDLGSFTITEAR